MRYPFDIFRLGTRYGQKGKYWASGFHSGQDFLSANYGGDGKIYPIYAGWVLKITNKGAYGNCVYVSHADGYITLYAHMKRVDVKVGQNVSEHTVLGLEGATGNVTGKHLHVEVHKGVYRYPAGIDPLAFIKFGMETEEMEKKIKLVLNGVEKEVTAIEKGGHNFIKLQDLRDSKISVDYDSIKKLPTVTVL